MLGELEDVKPLVIGWLEELAIQATKKGSKAALLYNRSLDKVRLFPGAVTDPKTLKLIQYVGDKTVEILTAKLRKHCEVNKYAFPSAFETSLNEAKRRGEDVETVVKKPRKKKQYVPRHRSGGFAIMIALYIRDKSRKGLTKNEIVEIAAPFADKSFSSNPSSNEFHSAWSSIKILINNELVYSTGRSPKLYLLTDEGMVLARQLKETVGVQSSPIRENIEISFDNNVLVSPNTSLQTEYKGLESSPIKYQDLFINSQESVDMLGDIQERDQTEGRSQTQERNQTQEGNINPLQQIHDVKNRIYDGIKYDVWPHDEFEVILLIDNREVRSQQDRDFFLKRLNSLKIKCEVRTLAVGDTLWIAKHLTSGKEAALNIICERKKLDDLAFSIKDGRFQEQKNRLKKTGMKHFYYLIEEAGGDKVMDMMESIQTAMSLTMTVSDFYLRKFKDIDETILFLASTTQVIIDNFTEMKTKLIVLRPRTINNLLEYTDSIVKFRNHFEKRSTSYECVHLYDIFQELLGKTGMMTVKEMFILMLMAIRGVSLERAISIQNRFHTPKLLLDFYAEHKNDPIEVRKKLLVHEFKDQIGNKKIGKVCLENIYNIWGGK